MNLLSPFYIDYTLNQKGREAFENLLTLAFKAFHDWYETIEDIIAKEDRAWVFVKATGTHTGEWNHFGVLFPPSGKSRRGEKPYYTYRRNINDFLIG